jgi:HAD superfamily hydrolase (TIGR01509 family)
MKKLVIWDFDGVISDTEQIWVGIWVDHLQEVHGIDRSYEDWYPLFSGIGKRHKEERVKEQYNITLSEENHQDIIRREEEKLQEGLTLTPGILDIFKKIPNQCIATGDDIKGTLRKIDILEIGDYFSKDNIFCIDMVEKGKPSPDTFILAYESMGYKPEDCVVIDDAISGVLAAQKAGIKDIILFVENHHTKKEDIIEAAKSLGVNKIAHTMSEVDSYLKT